jgi:hypothetical protein
MVNFVRTTSLVWNTTDKTKYNESIVFIEDTCQIYSNGVYYGCSPEIISAILELITDVKDIMQAKVYYDDNTGNLTFENIELMIE